MNKLIALKIIALILFSGTLGGLFFSSSVYDSVQVQIVETLCLSCIKLKPKTEIEYRFETQNGKSHPDFILKNLSYGPILLDYRITFCPGCDQLESKILSDVFNYTYEDPIEFDVEKPDLFYKRLEFFNTTFTFIHINRKDENSLDVPIGGIISESRKVYDTLGAGNPMLVFITYGYNQGIIEPMYSTMYGIGSENYEFDSENIKEELLDLIKESVDFYNNYKDAIK